MFIEGVVVPLNEEKTSQLCYYAEIPCAHVFSFAELETSLVHKSTYRTRANKGRGFNSKIIF